MKKMILLSALLLMSGQTITLAKTGDIKQPYFTTDILMYMDGLPIQGYSLNGRMLIELESLENYGFSVSYDESIRTLFVNKTNEPYENFKPHYDRGVEGNIAGYTYETDIKAYVNGKYIPTESINGKLLAVAEDLARVVGEGYYTVPFEDSVGSYGEKGEETYDLYGQYNTSRYFMTHTWDAANRILYLRNTAGNLPRRDERVKMITSEREKFYPVDNVIVNRYGAIVTAPGYCWFVWNNGAYADLSDVFHKYGLTYLGSPKIENTTFSDDGVYMYFDSAKERATHLNSHQFEPYDSGRFRFDSKNFVISRIS